ncbi:MAG TPA: RluA family pseudouridine synthase [Burkholderiales bacterium]|jgi:23S rRNA pseudouridine1911/1915/1917 synthase|nr:RluA family pseudouridine synthase [Burkholderiales bacterium]
MAKTISKTTTHYSEDRVLPGAAAALSVADDELADELELGAAGPGAQVLTLVAPMQAAGTRLDVWLAQALPQFSRNRLKTWIEAGAVTLNGAKADPKQKIRGAEAVEVLPQAAPEEGAFSAEAIPLDIVYEDASIIVINKPAGLVTHPAAGNWSGTLLNALLHHAPKLQGVPRAGIVHRLDKETSGLLVVAKTLEAQTALVRQLQARTVKRLYWALVAGRIDGAGTVEAAIGRHPTQRTRMAVLREDQSGAKAAVTHYRPLKHYSRAGAAATLAECRLETGRTHQIRVHMQHIKHPLVGDPLYGQAPSKSWFSRQALHARELALIHPRTGKTMGWEAPLPPDMEALLQSLEPA